MPEETKSLSALALPQMPHPGQRAVFANVPPRPGLLRLRSTIQLKGSTNDQTDMQRMGKKQE
ncbi:Hypothetical protein R9X50_00744600 [Acrodontium crateriforme]|uniref:Uncharacterized protein n=1 Tax=Acrodontium crateriforme TaxID=150365 RepID=A0AAQ3MB31_9PEZI|nr:Hypothetical protein R9X50_00744600 [Acrodontium crateriforme]